MSVDGHFAAAVPFSLGLLSAECMSRSLQEFGLGYVTVEKRVPASGTFYRGSLRASPFLRETVLSSGMPEDGESISLPPD